MGVVNQFKKFAKRIIDYKFDGDNNFRSRNQIVKDIRNYYNGVFSNNQNNQNNFLITYNSIKNFGYDDFNKLKNEVSSFKTEANKILKEVSGAIYEQGKTGFLNDGNNQDNTNPSILELTKLVTKSKNEI